MKPVRGYFRYCQIQKKVVPVDEVMVEVPANVAHGYIPDEMKPTKHPLDGKYYTSAAKFRAVTKAHGREEVGNEWEEDRDLEQTRDSAEFNGIRDHFRERYRYGKLTNYGRKRR